MSDLKAAPEDASGQTTGGDLSDLEKPQPKARMAQSEITAPAHETARKALTPALDKAVAHLKSAAPARQRASEKGSWLKSSADGLYALPWLAVVSSKRADVKSVLRQGLSASTPAEPADAPQGGDWWVWWMLERMVAIQCAPSFIVENAAQQTAPVADAAFDLLHKTRPKMPFNGVICVMDVDDFRGGEEDVTEFAISLRKFIHSAQQITGVTAPLFIVVNGLEKIAGHGDFFTAFPAESRSQALGVRPEGWEQPPGVIGMDGAFDSIANRLKDLRLAIYARKDHLPNGPAIFDFPEAVESMKPAVEAFAKTLLNESSWADIPFWRGLYFVAAGPATRPDAPTHTDDLFRRFLPTDANLAAPR